MNRSRHSAIVSCALLILALMLPASATAGTDSATADREPRGTYSGKVLGDHSRYSMTVNFTRRPDGNPEASVRYHHGINCSGKWRYLRTDGREIRFRERITDDPGGDCISSTSVVVYELRNDKLLVLFLYGDFVRSVVSPR